MPRCKTKAASKAKQISSVSNPSLLEDADTKTSKASYVKQEPMENESTFTVPDLSKFKFEKKPHVKIEFENASPEKEGLKGLWEPANWKDFLVNLRIMRANKDAPVDSMGCHMNMDQQAPPEVYRYQSLISLMLSSQTKDQVTFAAMERLRARGLTIDNILDISDEELGQLIYPVGFWKTKVKYIKKTTQTLKDQYNSDIPDSVEKLCKLTGVGPKMAHICMQVAWNKTTGIGVDTHVHRISNRIGWVKKPTSTPEETRKSLESWLPVDLWSEVNHLMVGFGQTICTPISPFCNECLNRDICPSSGKGRKSPSKRTPVKIEVKEEANSEDEFEDSVSKVNKIVTPKKVQPLQLDVKVGDDKKLQIQSKKGRTSPKLQDKSGLKLEERRAEEECNGVMDNAPIKKEDNSISKKLSKANEKKSPLKRKSPRNKAVPKDEKGEEISKKKKVLK